MNAGCTIVSPNYLPFARVLAQSYTKAHPGHEFFVLVVANVSESCRFDDGGPFTAISLCEIGLPDLTSLAFRYDILELNTNVKPTFLKYLLQTFNLETLVYLDPDIFVFTELKPVFTELERSSIVLTPHITSPIMDDLLPAENEFLIAGTYNLGFIAVKRTPETIRFLDWWEVRCFSQGFRELPTGLFVDQKWINLVPCLFHGVAICKDAGCNVAYWNLHERLISGEADSYLVNGSRELCFFHFSGILLDQADSISKYTNRYTLNNRSELREMFVAYRHRLRQSQHDAIDSIPYGFDQFTNGAAVSSLLRRIYSRAADRYPGNPFDATGELYITAQRKGLIGKADSMVKSSWNDYRASDLRVRCIRAFLIIALRILGPDRYMLLMKYLGHIAVLRNQTFLLM